MCDSGNFFGYETRRVGGNIPGDYSILTERHIEKRHKIDMVCGNIEGNVNCTYTFVAGPGGIGVRHPPKTYAIFFCSLVISIV